MQTAAPAGVRIAVDVARIPCTRRVVFACTAFPFMLDLLILVPSCNGDKNGNLMAEKILVVDDDLDSLKLIGLMLQRNGYEVIAANAGNQAITRAASDRPDLIILDVMMPDMNGYEVCRRLRKNPDTKGIPIIMFTAKTLIDDKVAGFEAGADDYLTKPTHPAELASRVKAILARNTAQRPAAINRGTTVGVLGAKGGVGTTTIALNVAAARLMAGENPIVADFRLGRGSLGLQLGIPNAHGMANVLSKPIDEIRPRLLESELTTHSSGLRALLSSARPQEAYLEYSAEQELAVVTALRTMGRPLVFDLGCGLSTDLLRLQADMDHLIVVVDPMPLTLSMARDLLTELESHRPEQSKLHVVVVNRAASSNPLSWSEVEQMVGREIRAIVALASELVSQSTHAHAPVVLYQPTAIASSQIIKLAEDINARARAVLSGEATS
jgi:CheY-like chemotaxis protein/MinD-like ATPase involved in chromosome partitioning or flagellar assembly